jgi:cysteinyl-tRNA synthetase
MLKIYNSLTRTEEAFVPLDPPHVRMYVCGMTVYDYCHLGHARVMIAFDIVQRWLRASGFKLTYVRNITDIDDKIIRRAAEAGVSVGALTERFIRAMHEDALALGVQKPDYEPRATEHVSEMLEMIGTLERRGLAYVGGSGDVNFSVRKFPDYGKLSGKSLAELRAGERVEVDPTKRDPLDFVLWKRAERGDPSWHSPWGDGRPGWHIECSAMSTKLLGSHFDIHGGGQDLQFPHHENEIAQTEGSLDEDDKQPFVKYWMHNGFVRMHDQKMSKSTGNVVAIRDLLAHHDAEVVRFFVLRSHYRSPLSYSDDQLDDARQALGRLYSALKDAPQDTSPLDWGDGYALRFQEAMDGDFNTPQAVAVLFELAGEINRKQPTARPAQLRRLGRLLGLLERDPSEFFHGQGRDPVGMPDTRISSLIEERKEARQARDFRRADEIRDELLRHGIALEDGPGGTTWRRAVGRRGAD